MTTTKTSKRTAYVSERAAYISERVYLIARCNALHPAHAYQLDSVVTNGEMLRELREAGIA